MGRKVCVVVGAGTLFPLFYAFNVATHTASLLGPGIGKSVAKRFAKGGYFVVLVL